MQITDKIQITNEDNMELMARYPDNYFDLAIVDPPYGINITNECMGGRKTVKPDKNKNWDNETPTAEYFKELFRVSKNQIIWGGNYMIEHLYNTSCFVVWDKKSNDGSNFADAEIAWTSFKTAIRVFKYDWIGFGYLNNPQKPIKLYKWILDKYAKQGDKILDTHLGSGSIAIACHDYGFDLTACELDKEYFDKAMERITNHTNQTKLF